MPHLTLHPTHTDTDTDRDGTAEPVRLHYTERLPDPSAVEGRDLLLLPGFGATTTSWEPLLPFLPRGHRVVALDLRNHGLSGTSRRTDTAANVADVVGVIRELGLRRPVLVGSSLGSIWATEVAWHHPDLIAGAVLVGAPAHANATVPGMAEGNRAMVAGVAADAVTAARATVPTWFGPLAGPLVHEWMVDQLRLVRVPGPGFADEITAYDPRPYLADVPVPLHFVHGAVDPIPLEVVQRAAELTTRQSLTVIPHAGHLPHVEVPGLFAEVLVELIATI